MFSRHNFKRAIEPTMMMKKRMKTNLDTTIISIEIIHKQLLITTIIIMIIKVINCCKSPSQVLNSAYALC